MIEEWRGGLGAGSRLRDQQIPVLYYQSKYAERLPIGKPEILKTFTPDRLKAFYTKWYRPDRMAVVVVGDLDPAKMEALVRTEFGPHREAGGGGAAASAIPVPLPAEVLIQGVRPTPRRRSRRSRSCGSGPGSRSERVADYRRTLVNAARVSR